MRNYRHFSLSAVAMLACVVLARGVSADVAPRPPRPLEVAGAEATTSDTEAAGAETSLGPLIVHHVDGVVISTERVSSPDGEVLLARIRPWDSENARLITTSWAGLTVYPAGFRLPSGSAADTTTAMAYTVEYVEAALRPYAAVAPGLSTVPVAGANRNAVRLNATLEDSTAQITIGAFNVGDAIIVFTMHRNNDDSAYFEPLRLVMEQLERVDRLTNEEE